MSCFHPLKVLNLGNKENGKKNIHFCMSDAEWELAPSWQRMTLPCGRCVGCRLEYSRQWANRCMLELQYHKESWFVTLTYDDEHVPVTYYAEDDDGAARGGLSLRFRDLELFWKRLRKAHSNDRIRYYACGEYGSNTYRPHYHAIVFGLTLTDLRPYKRSPQNYDYFISDSLTQCWGLGFVVVGQVTWDTCAYTARYIMKKMMGDWSGVYESFNMEPEQVRMSRKPGIARQYYDDHPDIYKTEWINLKTDTQGLKIKPPRYYDQLFDIEYPEKMSEIKKRRRRFARAAEEMKQSRTTLDVESRLEVEEASFVARIKSLERKL